MFLLLMSLEAPKMGWGSERWLVGVVISSG